MGTTQRRGLRLVATDGHSHWAEPELRFLLASPAGYGMGLDCTFGGVAMVHWIGRDTQGRAQWQDTPYAFGSAGEAEAARDELAAQTSGEGE